MAFRESKLIDEDLSHEYTLNIVYFTFI